LNHPNKAKTNPGLAKGVESVKVRRATRADAKDIVDLIVRLKRLNNEFDPLFGVVADAKERAERYVSSSFDSRKTLFLVAVSGGKIIGVVRGEIRERLFYQPSVEGHLTDMYVLPEHRRKQLGEEILERAMDEFRKMGAEIIVAELPSRNEIGVHFYSKHGFRRLLETFAHSPG
jgi:ribosomal protein S18 acetylase RimI-like enzyme